MYVYSHNQPLKYKEFQWEELFHMTKYQLHTAAMWLVLINQTFPLITKNQIEAVLNGI